MRLVALVEKTDEEVEAEITRELDENPALERKPNAYASTPVPAATPVETPDFDETLGEALLRQLGQRTQEDPTVRKAASYMVGALDGNGYLTRTLPQLRDDIELEGTIPATTDQIRRAYDLLRSLEPPGVGAQDLRDCLLLQLRAKEGADYGDAREIVRHFFDLYSRRNLQALASASSLPLEKVKAADILIRGLNPKPGAAFAADPAQALARSAVQPDFMVETDGKRAWITLPNSLSELQIEDSFTVDPENPEAAKFVRDRRAAGQSFIDLLRRRQETLLAIGRALVQFQAPFFTAGDDPAKIRPMVLRQLAEATGLDLTLISRAVNGKWLATQWGVYPLKYFFNHRTGADDEQTSAREIEALIQELIQQEQEPLTDDRLAELLAQRGHKVARRTVAKYRTRLKILPARLRR